MSRKRDGKLIVSEEDAEIIATLFRQGVSDFPTILKSVRWDKIKQQQFYDFMIMMGYYDFDDYLNDENSIAPTLANVRVPKEKYTEFFQNLPIEFSEDSWDEEWYRNAYYELRKILVEINKHNPAFKKKNGYSLDDVELIIGMTFCPLLQKPEDLCADIQKLMRIRLRRSGKDIFSFNEVLLAFDKAFANYFD